MGSNTNVQRPSSQEQLSGLQDLLRKKHDTCSEVYKVAEEQTDNRSNRRAKKEAEQEELRQKLRRIISEQEDERSRYIENNVTANLPSALLPRLDEVSRERMADLTAFVQECTVVRNEYHEHLMTAIRR